jgi:hypothetical protein
MGDARQGEPLVTQGADVSAESLRRSRRPLVVSAVAIAAVSATVLSMSLTGGNQQDQQLPRVAKEYLHEIQGVDEAGGAGGETKEITSALAQFNDARNAPGFALPGGYTAAATQIAQMSSSGGQWSEVTDTPYNSDDPHFRDYYANTSGGSGFVTGRTQALAAGVHAGDTLLFAAGAVGGVYRKDISAKTGWVALSDQTGSRAGIPALSSGALAYNAHTDELWFATGDGSTGATTYTGNGVWVLDNASTAGDGSTWRHLADGVPAKDQPNDGTNLFDGAVIQQLRFSSDGSWVYAPTSFGLWRRSTSDLTSEWQPVFVPNPAALPSSSGATGEHSTDNYVTDVAIDPTNSGHVVAALGWVAGGAANGWYDGRFTNGSWTFTRSNVTGAINPKDIGRTTFAWGQKKLYALVHNPDHAAQGISYSELGGVYVSKSGSINGPWSKIADSQKLSQSGSALDPTIDHAGAVNGGYQPGVQAWYNQFLAVDPANDNHVYVGLEEVFETRNGGSSWTTPGPYWNFFFPCWGTAPKIDQAGCNVTTHADQHAVAIAGNQVFVGNDGGIYTRPVSGKADQAGHATDWTSLSSPASGTPDFLQYYAVGVGNLDAAKTKGFTDATDGVIVSGGLQDNGGSILVPGRDTMASNFGGDGGDVLVDPNDGCRIVQEYVDLTMRVTNVCAATDPSSLDSFLDPSKANTRSIAPPETAARFTAPFAADHSDIDNWLAAGQHVWLNTKGFNIASGDDWTQVLDLGAPHTATAVALDGGDAIVPFCGSCNAGSSFQSGYAVRTDDSAVDKDHWTTVLTTDAKVVNGPQGETTLPNRMISGADVYHDSTGQVHYLLAFNGFSRHWVEGPGAGIGHVFESTDGTNWSDLSAGLPDVPANTVKGLADGRIVVGTDLGAFVRTDGTWSRLGSGLPTSVVNDLEPGPDGDLYAATYGRGIWKLQMTGLPEYAGGGPEQDQWWNQHVEDPSSVEATTEEPDHDKGRDQR